MRMTYSTWDKKRQSKFHRLMRESRRKARARLVMKALNKGVVWRDIAARYHVSQSTIAHIRNGSRNADCTADLRGGARMKDYPRILDLFCGAGGAGSGYRRAGLIPFGVDIARQPRYPYGFARADAIEYLKRYGREYDVIAASPPCQGYSDMKAFVKHEYPLLIEPLREILQDIGRPYIIENVEGARAHMRQPITLCGVMFPDRRVYRHRLFESNVLLTPPYVCDGNHHDSTPPAGSGRSPKGYMSITGGGIRGVNRQQRCEAMGIHWMTNDEMNESFPPEYTHWLGAQVMQHLGLTPLSWPKTRAVQERMFA